MLEVLASFRPVAASQKTFSVDSKQLRVLCLSWRGRGSRGKELVVHHGLGLEQAVFEVGVVVLAELSP